jgi:gluconolactonase
MAMSGEGEMLSLADLRVVAEGLDHPEGVAPGLAAELYAGGEAGQVYRIDPVAATHEQVADTGGFVLGVAVDGTGAVYACDAGQAAVLRIDIGSGMVESFCESAGGEPLTVPNWAAFDAEGSLWLSDSGPEAVDVREGRLVRIPPGGGDGEVLDLPPLHFPNGLCVSPDGTVYVLESLTPRLSALRDSGLEPVAELPGVVPDGLALDDAGFLVGCYYPFRILRVSSDGDVQTVLDDPTGIDLIMPTNLAFFGPELRTLAVAQLGGWSVKAIEVPWCGVPLHYPG